MKFKQKILERNEMLISKRESFESEKISINDSKFKELDLGELLRRSAVKAIDP